MQRWYIPALALLAFSYPMTAVIATMLDWPIGTVNLTLKVLFAGMFLLSLCVSIPALGMRAPSSIKPLLLFFVLYGFRLAYDIVIRDIAPPTTDGSYIIAYFFLLTLLPLMSIAVAYGPRDLERLRKWSFFTLFGSCFFVLLYFAENGVSLTQALELQRLEIRGDQELKAQLNPITVGLTGGLLAIFSIGQLTVKGRGWRFEALLSIAGLALGVLCLLLSGSRGPLAAFAVALTFYFFALTRARTTQKHLGRSPLSRRVQFILGLGGALALYFLATTNTAFLAVSRLIDTFGGGDGRMQELRQLIYQDALDRFMDSPFLGDGYLVHGQLAYVHNAVLEAFVATGLVGGTLFLFSVFLILRAAWRLATKFVSLDTLPWALAAVLSLTVSMFSKTLGQAPEVWLVAALVVCMASRVAPRRNPAAAQALPFDIEVGGNLACPERPRMITALRRKPSRSQHRRSIH